MRTGLRNYEQPKIEPLGTIRAFLEQLQTAIPKATCDTDYRVRKLQGFIDSRDGSIGWDVDRICRELGLGISGSHSARLFKRCIGFGVREYAKRRRLQIAAHLLETTTLSVKEIAANVGYRSTWDFDRRFKELFHLSPMEFRKVFS